jgi:uncharacterized RDD family membrane protein YckC
MTVKTSAAQPAWEGYGGFWIRFLAYLVDSVILFIALILVAAGSAFLGELGGLVVTVAYLVGPILYWSMMHASARQATYGKALLGLKVTDGSRKRISFVRALAREIAKIISAIPLMIGFILAGFTKRKQALHDFFVNTTVMREGPSHVVAGLAIGVLGWVAPVALIMVLGVGMFMGAAGSMMGGDMMAQMIKEAERQAAAQQPPMPPRMPQKPPAPPVAAKPPAPPPPPAPAPAPVQVAAAAPVPAPAPAPVVTAKPEPKPEPKPVAEPQPKPKPVPVAETKPKPQPRAEAKPVRAPAQPMTVVALPPSALPAAPDPAPQPIQLKTASDGPKYNDLMTAVLYGDSAGVSELLAFGKWPDKPDTRGLTPLMAAAMLGDLQNAEALLKAGAEAGRALPVARERGDGAMMTLLEKYQHR